MPWRNCTSLPGYPRQGEAERQPDGERPIGRRTADTVSNCGIEKHIAGGWLPDDPQKRRIVRPLTPRALAIDFADEPDLRVQRQLADDTPRPEQPPVPVQPPASIEVP